MVAGQLPPCRWSTLVLAVVAGRWRTWRSRTGPGGWCLCRDRST